MRVLCRRFERETIFRAFNSKCRGLGLSVLGCLAVVAQGSGSWAVLRACNFAIGRVAVARLFGIWVPSARAPLVHAFGSLVFVECHLLPLCTNRSSYFVPRAQFPKAQFSVPDTRSLLVPRPRCGRFVRMRFSWQLPQAPWRDKGIGASRLLAIVRELA